MVPQPHKAGYILATQVGGTGPASVMYVSAAVQVRMLPLPE